MLVGWFQSGRAQPPLLYGNRQQAAIVVSDASERTLPLVKFNIRT